MSENENKTPLTGENEAVSEDTAPQKETKAPEIPGSFFTQYSVPTQMPDMTVEFNGEQSNMSEEPAIQEIVPEAKESYSVPEEATAEAEITDVFEDIPEPEAETTEESETVFFEEPEAVEELSEDVQAEEVQEITPDVDENQQAQFNPYAPKTQPEENLYRYPNEGINPSYNRPVYTNPYNGNNVNNTGNYNQQGFYGQPPSGKDSKGRKIAVGVVAVCVAVALIALLSSFFGSTGDNTQQTTTTAYAGYQEQTTLPTTQNVTVATTQPVTQVINSVWVAEKVRPSVVGVMAYMQGELAGEGSGVLMSEDTAKGCTYIVTCAHVIDEPGCEFGVLLLDGSRYDAEVVALDVRTDIGVLKVNKTGLPIAEFGDSSSLKIGEPIYAIGNPGGSEYFGSITNGIIAAIDRSISATYTMTCIQHNAAINPGNSGGALVNSAGQVIGINSSKIAKTDYEGMGFAVPSSIFRSVVSDLIQYGYVPNRPELGIKYASVSDYQLYSIIVSIKGLPKGSVIIAEIPEGSALAGSGAEVGDLIVAVNGKKMDTSDVLLDLIDTGAVGDTLTLTLCRIQSRSYETTTFDVTVQLVENKGSVTTTTQAQTLPQQDNYGSFEDFFGGFFGW